MGVSALQRAEAARDCLDAHELQLYLRYNQGKGKSLGTLAQLYRSRYEGENGVREALNAITLKVEERLRTRAGGTVGAAAMRHAGEDDDDAGDGGVPVKRIPVSASNGSMNGAGAAGEPRTTPPIRSAPAAPSRSASTPPPATPPVSRSSAETVAERDARVVAYVAEHGVTGQSDLMRAIPIPSGSINTVMDRVVAAGKLVRHKAAGRCWYQLPEAAMPPNADELERGPVTGQPAPAPTPPSAPAQRRDGLTVNEGEAMDALCDAAKAYGRCERQHPDELNDFIAAIHRCQDLLAIRVARRAFPGGWPTHR